MFAFFKRIQKNNKTHYKYLVFFVVVAALGAVFLLIDDALFYEEEKEKAEPLPMVEVMEPQTKHLKEQVTSIGNTDPLDARAVVPQLSGEVETVYVSEGDQVEAGEKLMKLDDEDYILQLDEAKASRDAASAQLAEAQRGARTAEKKEAKSNVSQAEDAKAQMEREYERVKALHEEGYASDQELEQVELQYENAKDQLEAARGYQETVETGARAEQLDALRAQVNRAEASVQLAEQMVERTEVTAPASGEISEVMPEEGEMVGTEEPAFILLDTNYFQVKGAVPEDYVETLDKEDSVDLRIPAVNESEVEGKIDYIGQMPLEEGSAGYPVEIKIPEAIEEKVRAGMYAEIDFTVAESEEAAVIPRRALIEYQGEQGIFVVNEKHQCEFIATETGLSEEGYLEIKNEKLENKQVIVDGMNVVAPGDEVEIIENGVPHERGDER